ncbi:MAG: GntR family transcriptional regulator [Acutalibacteraceae bacterium]
MSWHFDDDRPIYNQIVTRILTDVVTGVYSPGERLPSVREFAADAGVNPNTMQKALVDLERTGVVYAHTTSGRFVTDDRALLESVRKSMLDDEIAHFVKRCEKFGLSAAGAAEMLAAFKERE